MIKSLYTVRKCRLSDDVFYGPSHGSHDGEETICGQKIDYKWYITNNTFDGEITCKKCRKKLNERFQ